MREIYCQTIKDWFATIWDKGDLASLPKFMTDQTVFNSADGLALKGFSEFKASQLQMRTFFENFRCQVLATVVEGNVVASTVQVQAVHRLSRKIVRFQAMNRVQFDPTGKIREAWDTIDWLHCLIQLGSLPKDMLIQGFAGKKMI